MKLFLELLFMILKVPAYMLLLMLFGILLSIKNQNAWDFAHRYLEGKLSKEDWAEFIRRGDQYANHITIVIFLCTLTYFIIQK